MWNLLEEGSRQIRKRLERFVDFYHRRKLSAAAHVLETRGSAGERLGVEASLTPPQQRSTDILKELTLRARRSVGTDHPVHSDHYLQTMAAKRIA